MNTKLKHIQNWLELAQAVNWSTAALAKRCSVSVRTLERYFSKEMGQNPTTWLCEQRQLQAIELLRDGLSVKETAVRLGYKQAGNFFRKFTKHWGSCPAMQRPQTKLIQTENVAK